MAEPAAEQSAARARRRTAVKDIAAVVDHHPRAPQHPAAQPARLVVGLHPDGDLPRSQNPGKVERLALYAPVWLRSHASLVQTGPGPLGAYRTVTREQAQARWLNGVPEDKKAALIPRRLVRAMGRRHLGHRSGRRQAKSAGGARAERHRAGHARVLDRRQDRCTTRPQITVPTLIAIGEWDRDTPPYMAQAFFPLLVNSPGKRLVMLAEGTHHMMLEKNRRRCSARCRRSSTKAASKLTA